MGSPCDALDRVLARADRQRRLHDGELLMAARTPRLVTATDEGLAEIDRWHAWFLAAHTARLQALNLSPAEQDAHLETVRGVAAAVTARMRDDYRARREVR